MTREEELLKLFQETKAFIDRAPRDEECFGYITAAIVRGFDILNRKEL